MLSYDYGGVLPSSGSGEVLLPPVYGSAASGSQGVAVNAAGEGATSR